MKCLIILILLLLTLTSFGQDKDPVGVDSVFIVHEPMPAYPGGYAEMRTFISKNLKYPKGSRTVKGTVFIGFVVNDDGSLSDFSVVKGLAAPFDNSALETVKKMPNWIPARKDNKAIRTRMVIPIKFDR